MPEVKVTLDDGQEIQVVGRSRVEVVEHSEIADPSADLPPLPEGRTRRFFTIGQLGSPKPIEWLVKGWIAVGELSMVFGQGDSYKSFLALHWGLEAAHEGVGYSVVYIAAEGAHGLRSRVPAWLRHHDSTADEFPGFRVDEIPVALDQPGEIAAWLAEVEDELGEAPDWVIVDTLSMCFNGDESSPQDMNNFVKGLERLRRSTDKRTAITVIHHTTKDGRTERGTPALRNATFSVIRLSAKSHNGYTVLVECDRMKDAERPSPRRVKFKRIELGKKMSSLAYDSSKDATSEVTKRNAK